MKYVKEITIILGLWLLLIIGLIIGLKLQEYGIIGAWVWKR